MRKIILYRFLAIGFVPFLVTTAALAQEPAGGLQEEEHRSVINEVLDEIEESLDPDDAGPGVPLVPVLYPNLEERPVDEDLPEMEEEEDLGEAVEPLKNPLEVKIIPLLHAEAASMIESLKAMKSPEGNVTYNEEDRTLVLEDLPDHVQKMSDFIRETDVALETRTFNLEYVLAADIESAIRQHLTKDVGQIQLGKDGKNIVVTDTPAAIGVIAELIRGLDVFSAEVSVRAYVIEIILNEEHLQGVDWEAIVSGYQKMLHSEEAADSATPLSLGTVSAEDYEILLEALDTVGVVNTLFEENKVIDNETAGIIDSPASSEGDEKIRLFLTPFLKKDEPLQIGLKISDTIPEEATIEMKDTETIVIGSVFEDVLAANPWKIPLLGDLPLLGFVFRNEGQEIRKAEIVMFLTVKIKEKNTQEKGL